MTTSTASNFVALNPTSVHPYLKRIFKLRGPLMIPPVGFLVLSNFGVVENPRLTFGLGAIAFGLGFALRTVCQARLCYRIGGKKTLTTSGLYEYTRNPLYIGNTLLLLGATFFSGLLWFVPVMLLWCAVVYGFVIRYEEAHLREKYGESFADYCARVPRWFPRRSTPAAPKWSRVERVSRRQYARSAVAESADFLLIVPFIAKAFLI